MIWYDMIWYDMIWYDIYIYIYIYITAIALTPGGSSTSHIYTQTIHKIQRKERYRETGFRKSENWNPYVSLAIFIAYQPVVDKGLLIVASGFTLIHTTLSRTHLVKWSARRRDLYLKTHNIHKRTTPMPPVAFETSIPTSKRPFTHALDSAVNGIGVQMA
jgi:hypothetical protein